MKKTVFKIIFIAVFTFVQLFLFVFLSELVISLFNKFIRYTKSDISLFISTYYFSYLFAGCCLIFNIIIAFVKKKIIMFFTGILLSCVLIFYWIPVYNYYPNKSLFFIVLSILFYISGVLVIEKLKKIYFKESKK